MNPARLDPPVTQMARDARAVRAAVLFGLCLAFVSETLGAFEAFARGPVAAVWLVAILGAGAACLRHARRARAASTRTSGRPALPGDPVARFTLGCILLVLAGCLVTALLSPPNNGDVVAYHMPRVRHWIQNRSFGHYPSNSLRQLSYPPWASYFVAQLQLLVGGDRLASLPQWLALLGCILVTASLGRRLGGPRAALPTALACATVPMAVLQATNPQTDLVAAFWLACFVHLVFARHRYRPTDVIWMGGALGLGLATKPTVMLFAPPFLAILALRAGRRGGRSGLVVPIAVVLLAVLPTLPNSLRNLRTFGRPLGPDLGVTLGRRDLRALTSNVLRHAALAYPSVVVWKGIAWAHAHLLHLDAGDPKTTFPPDAGFDPKYIAPLSSPDENFAASPLHVTIALAAAAAGLTRRNRRGGRAALRGQLTAALALGFLFYCGALPWQPWANRLLLPLVVLASPLVGWALSAVSAPLRAATSGLLGVVGIIVSVTSVRHPLLVSRRASTAAHPSPSILTRSRADLYFADYGPGLRESYEELLRRAAAGDCARVGLVSSEYDPEYLVWVTLDRIGKPVQIRHVGVENGSRAARLELAGAEPCGRVTMQPHGGAEYQSAGQAAPPGGP